jgi:hypothetical protein
MVKKVKDFDVALGERIDRKEAQTNIPGKKGQASQKGCWKQQASAS